MNEKVESLEVNNALPCDVAPPELGVMSKFGVSSSVANLKRVAVRTPTRDADYQGAHWLGAPESCLPLLR
ncbi:MAG: hypothetical protein QNM01_06545 [Actinomycetes bacterium]